MKKMNCGTVRTSFPSMKPQRPFLIPTIGVKAKLAEFSNKIQFVEGSAPFNTISDVSRYYIDGEGKGVVCI